MDVALTAPRIVVEFLRQLHVHDHQRVLEIGTGTGWTPFNVKAEAAGLPGLGYATGPPTPYIVNTKWAKSHPAQVSGLLKGLIEGTWAYQTRESDALPVLAKWLSLDVTKDQQVLKRSFTAYLPPVQWPADRCQAGDFAPYVRFLPAGREAALKDLKPLIDTSYGRTCTT